MTADTCRDWRGALGSAALGRIDITEEIGLRAHLDGCADCHAKLRDLTTVAGTLDEVSIATLFSAPREPPAALLSRLLDRIARERGARRMRRTRRMGIAASFIAAAAIAVALLVGIGGNESGLRVALPGVGGATAIATLHSEAAGTMVDVRVSGLEPGHYYWLWLTGDGGRRISAGSFSGSKRGDRRPAHVRRAPCRGETDLGDRRPEPCGAQRAGSLHMITVFTDTRTPGLLQADHPLRVTEPERGSCRKD